MHSRHYAALWISRGEARHAARLGGGAVDPVLFGLSYDFVGDLSETIALIWPAQFTGNNAPCTLRR